MSTLVQLRHRQLRHHLPARHAQRHVDESWLRARFEQYPTAAGIEADLHLAREVYAAATGTRPPNSSIGMAYRPIDRTAWRCAFIDLEQLHTRGQAELEIAHEVMHLTWWSYGHRPIAFLRAQQLIDTLAGLTPAPAVPRAPGQ